REMQRGIVRSLPRPPRCGCRKCRHQVRGSDPKYAPTERGPLGRQGTGLVVAGTNRCKRRMRSDRGQRGSEETAPTPRLDLGIETTGVRPTRRERYQRALPSDPNLLSAAGMAFFPNVSVDLM